MPAAASHRGEPAPICLQNTGIIGLIRHFLPEFPGFTGHFNGLLRCKRQIAAMQTSLLLLASGIHNSFSDNEAEWFRI
jgi:hypothetical protein